MAEWEILLVVFNSIFLVFNISNAKLWVFLLGNNNQFHLNWNVVDGPGFNLILNRSNDKFSYDDRKNAEMFSEKA